jgi:hypothetical protein
MEATLSKKQQPAAASGKANRRRHQGTTRRNDDPPSQIEGYELLKRIRGRLNELGGDAEQQMLDCLGLQRTYWNAFCNGHRPISGLIRHKERRDWLAEFLGVPPITLRIWAGDIGEDELHSTGQDALWLEMERARKDIRFNVLTPKSKAEFDKLPANIKLLMVTMYRTITEHDLSDQKRALRRKPAVESL